MANMFESCPNEPNTLGVAHMETNGALTCTIVRMLTTALQLHYEALMAVRYSF